MRHVPHLYLPPPWDGTAIQPSEPQLHHLHKVLRRVRGSEVTYTDGKGTSGRGRLVESKVERGEEHTSSRPSPRITLAVAPVAEKARCRFIVEKLTELGVDELLWLSTRHTEARPPSPSKSRAWAAMALEQSRGAWMTEVGESAKLSDLDASRLIVAERGNPSPPAVVDSDIIVVGPPGGMEADEIPGGARRIGLGKRVLRVETAAIAAAVLVLDRSGRIDSVL